jgi:hypothetical protein
MSDDNGPKTYVDRDPDVVGGRRGRRVTVDELVDKGHTMLERIQRAFGRWRARATQAREVK